MMMQTMTQQPESFGDTSVSGWTDAEIEAYYAWADEQDRFDDSLTGFPSIDCGEPPF